MLNNREEKIITEFKKLVKEKSSHDLAHSQRVIEHALRLIEIYGGRKELIIPACLLHDLGRIKKNLHGKKSLQESVKLAEPVLKRSGYRKEEIGVIVQAIKGHDQPGFSSELLEAKILKDADFLDGFSIWGLLRSIYYTAEIGEPMEKALERIDKKMKARYEGLEFFQSKQMAQECYLLVRLLLGYLEKRENLDKKLFPGKLIVFEGTSGTGKETQAKLLAEYLNKEKQKAKIVFHPSLRLKKTLKEWRRDNIGLLVEAFLFIADRCDFVERELLPVLKKGELVISLRNRLSTLVYQTKTDWERDLINFLYAVFEPCPEIIFHFDLNPEEALSRAQKRSVKTGKQAGVFEKLALLKKHREKYKRVLKNFENVVMIDAARKPTEIQEEIRRELKKRELI